MTAYTVGFAYTVGSPYSISLNLAIKANDYAVRVVQIGGSFQYAQNTGGPANAIATRYEGSTISGGVLLTPSATREGSDPASATVRHQTGTWAGGGGAPIVPGTAVSISGTPRQLNYFEDKEKWQPPAEIIVAPGSTLDFKPYSIISGISAYFAFFQVWFDEEDVERST